MSSFDRSVPSKYYNSNKNNSRYMDLKSNIEKSPDFDNSQDFNMHLCTLYYNIGMQIRNNSLNFHDSSTDDNTFRNLLSSNLSIVYTDLLKNTALLPSLLDSHNSQFSAIGTGSNKPLRRNMQDLSDLFLSTNNDSIIELLAKNMDWCSKTTKEIEIVKRNVLEQIPGDIDTNGYTMEYLYQHVSSCIMNDKTIMSQLLESEGTSEENSICAFLENLLKETNEKVGSNISITDLYKYCACSYLQKYLYKIKSLSQIKIYKEESKNREKDIKSGVCIEIERDKRMSESATDFNDQFNVYIPFYINCFRDHTNDKDFISIIKEQVMSSEDTSKMPLDALESIPFRPFLTIKLKPENVLELLGILKEYDNPKINCLRNEKNQTHLDKVYAYLADVLHHSINYTDSSSSKSIPPSQYMTTDIIKFKSIFAQDEDLFKKQIGYIDDKRQIYREVDYDK